LVEDHIHFALGRQSFYLGDLDAALKFFLKLLRASRQTATQQSAYLREFLHIYKVRSLSFIYYKKNLMDNILFFSF